jgi:hypothetical protein
MGLPSPVVVLLVRRLYPTFLPHGISERRFDTVTILAMLG